MCSGTTYSSPDFFKMCGAYVFAIYNQVFLSGGEKQVKQICRKDSATENRKFVKGYTKFMCIGNLREPACRFRFPVPIATVVSNFFLLLFIPVLT